MDVKIANVQFQFKKYESFSDFEKQILGIFENVPKDCDYVLFPELMTIGLLTTFEGYENFTSADNDKLHVYLEEYINLFNSIATERKQAIIAGTTIEKEGEQYYNTAYIFDGKGSYAKHRKTHIFPAEAAWKTQEGDVLDVFEIGPAKIAVATCYEIEIPEIPTIYSRKGTEIIFCPSYTFTEHGFWRVRHCAESRAIENQVYVVHSPIIGNIEGSVEPGFGKCSIITPCEPPWVADGIVIESQVDTDDVLVATLNIDTLYDRRANGVATTYNDRFRRKALYQKYEEVMK
ncbi:nitrilase-related carbon-nitrogen hydrolase [Lysinibacillus antri]|uniref:Amidohydrolase n=1 Tax=Lysinibacillus antri TaxID=2498145 RepID=A0A432L723_9BACI|nr:nitrilase-related carbon-nitrogen hydrolase [Lysinibacillus antri]RUL47264.1 amidohydrolase [Lysinibacillus antri]